MLKINGFDEAILGPAWIWRDSTVVSVLVYDAEQMRTILMERDGMSPEEARVHRVQHRRRVRWPAHPGVSVATRSIHLGGR